MMMLQIKDQVNIKFCVWLGKTFSQAHDMIRKAYRAKAMAQAAMYR
jgi:hypothetical protein